ncbi:MAG: hypothetical protein JO198_11025 [Candidatus Dormibacteraeota bacterium]|nr:hypothetical protein [Candidatus Dormibacteraeota bacterium]
MSAAKLPTWRERVKDEFCDQRGGARKAWWVVRFAAGLATLGNFSFGVAALGSGEAHFARAVRKAAELDRSRNQPGGGGDT